MTGDEAFDEVCKVAAKNFLHGETLVERVLYELDRREERISELELDVEYWKERYQALKEEAA